MPLGESECEAHVLAVGETVREELVETVAQVVAQCEELCTADGETLPDEVTHTEAVSLGLEDCEAHWLPLDVGVLLRHRVEEAEGERVSEGLPLGEREGLRVAHTVGVCVLHTVPLSVETALEERDMVVVGLSEGDAETLPEAVPPAREPEEVAVPRGPSAAAPPLALGLTVPHPLAEKEGVWVGDADSESVTLAHEERETLAVELCESDRVPSGLP